MKIKSGYFSIFAFPFASTSIVRILNGRTVLSVELYRYWYINEAKNKADAPSNEPVSINKSISWSNKISDIVIASLDFEEI